MIWYSLEKFPETNQREARKVNPAPKPLYRMRIGHRLGWMKGKDLRESPHCQESGLATEITRTAVQRARIELCEGRLASPSDIPAVPIVPSPKNSDSVLVTAIAQILTPQAE